MAFRVMPLEDRIVFDAAGLADAEPDAEAEAQEAFEPEGAPDGPAETDAFEADPTDSEADQPVVDTAAEPGSAASGTRVLVIADNVDPDGVLADAAADHVIRVAYDASTASLDSLRADLQASINDQEVESIAFAVHGARSGQFSLLSTEVTNLETLAASDAQQSFWKDVGALVREGGRIDLLACNVAASESGMALVAELEALTGRNVAASTDDTGDPDAGGDWELETDGIDLVAAYFDAEAVDAFDDTMPGEPQIHQLWESVSVASDGTQVTLDWNGDAFIWDDNRSPFANGVITIAVSDNPHINDVFTLKDPNGIDGFDHDGTNLERGGTNIGTFSEGNGTLGNYFSIDFNANATVRDASYWIRQIQFSAANLGDGPRQADFYVKDGHGDGFEPGDAGAWPAANVTIYVDGPEAGGTNEANCPDANDRVVLDDSHLDATGTTGAGGDADLIYYIDDRPDHGWIEDDSGMEINTFTQQDVNDDKVYYAHDGGDPRFDRFSYYVEDADSEHSTPTYFVLDVLADNANPYTNLDVDNFGGLSPSRRETLFGTDESVGLWIWDAGFFDDLDELKQFTMHLGDPKDGANEGLMHDMMFMYGFASHGFHIENDGRTLTLTYDPDNDPATVSHFNGHMLRNVLKGDMDASVGYSHTILNRTEGDRHIRVTTTDSADNVSNAAYWIVDVEAATGEPVVTRNWMDINEGTSRTITNDFLRTVDSDTGPANLTYNITWLPNHGWLRLGGSNLSVGSQFTQADVNNGRLKYIHDGSPEEWNDGFDFEVRDPEGHVTWGWFEIEVIPEGAPLWEPYEDPMFDESGEDVMESGEEFLGEEGDFGEMTGEMGDFLDTAEGAAESFVSGEEGFDLESGLEESAGNAGEADAGLEEVRSAFDTVMETFGSDSEVGGLFAGAVEAIEQAEAFGDQATRAVEIAFGLLDELEGSARELFQDYIDQVAGALGSMRGANQDLIQLLLAAQKMGDRFDKAHGDAIKASIEDLTADNEQVLVAYRVLNEVTAAVRNAPAGEAVDLAQLRQIAEAAAESARAEVAGLRAHKDKAVDDKVDASLQELLEGDRRIGDVVPQGGNEAPEADGPIGRAAPAPDAQENGTDGLTGTAAALSALSVAGCTTAPAPATSPARITAFDARHRRRTLRSATTVLQRTRAPGAAELLADLVHASTAGRG